MDLFNLGVFDLGELADLHREYTALDYARATDQLNAGNLDRALAFAGRNQAPQIMWDAHERGVLNPADYHRVGRLWSMCEFPDRALDHDLWDELFAAAGYCVDGVPADRPDAPIRLYRGAVADRRYDWSWTDDLRVAERYASGTIGGREKGTVWTALVDPPLLLARNTERGEAEYVVFADALDGNTMPGWDIAAV